MELETVYISRGEILDGQVYNGGPGPGDRAVLGVAIVLVIALIELISWLVGNDRVKLLGAYAGQN